MTAEAADAGTAPKRRREPLTAAGLPPAIEQDCRRGPYRVPLAQFIANWNRAADPAALIADAPTYEGPDPWLLATVAAVVHALCARDDIAVPDWVFGHRAGADMVLFAANADSEYGRWVRDQAPEASHFHRVYFQPELLDKGSPRQWDPIKT